MSRCGGKRLFYQSIGKCVSARLHNRVTAFATHHDDEVNLWPARQLDAMESVEARQERVRVGDDMGVIVLEDRA